MLVKLLRFLRGTVRFRIMGNFPERFINLSAKRGVGVFDTLWENGVIYGSLYIGDYRHIRNIAAKSGVRLRITEKRGLPFILRRHKYRYGILIGALLMLLISLVMQNFLWTMEIRGIETISVSALTSALESKGFKTGAFKNGLDLHKIQRELMLKFKEIGWMSINLIGTRAEIEIKEKAVKPEAEYSAQASNIKASSDGVILATNIKRGTGEISVGSAVFEGQLLVSGITENAHGEIGFVDADAQIIARTSYTFESSVDEVNTEFLPSAQSNRGCLQVFSLEIPVVFSPQNLPYTSYVFSRQVYLFDKAVPLVLHNEQMTFYEQTNVKYNAEEANELLKTQAVLYRVFKLSRAEHISQRSDVKKQGGTYYAETVFECKEDIAVKEKLIVNDE